MKIDDKIFIAGHRGMVGSNLVNLLKRKGYKNLITKEKSELNLLNQNDTKHFLEFNKPDIVVIAAAKVGGIGANIKYPANFFYENSQIQNNIIHFSSILGVKKVIYLGSSCIYPKDSPQPIKEEYLLNGPLEETNEGYALAKISGLKMLEYYNRQMGLEYLSLMPCNIYGPNDSFDLENSHVMTALIKKIYDAKINHSNKIDIWGSGIARREFLHVYDLVEAILYFSNINTGYNFINIGTGEDISILDLANLIKHEIGFKGIINCDISKPDGMLLKRLDVTKMKTLGFKPRVNLVDGIREVINIYEKLKKQSI
jgi:GDP-L-fucose synthase